jgi:pyruvate formate lyase activating enzyme
MDHLPLIFDIRRFSLDDGPGIRTTIFFKGCPLACSWCHNPEGISPERQIVHFENRCIGCATCAKNCSRHAIPIQAPGRIDPRKCSRCGSCVMECPAKAMALYGTGYSPDALVELLLADQVFYHTSGGGVTFSGGEPTLYPDYVRSVMRLLKKEKIHIALQTAGYFDCAEFEAALLPFIDILFFDLKIIDRDEFKRFTGGDVDRVIANFKRLCFIAQDRVTATIPLIPGATDTKKNLSALNRLIEDAGCSSRIFRPHHSGGTFKRDRMVCPGPSIILNNKEI